MKIDGFILSNPCLNTKLFTKRLAIISAYRRLHNDETHCNIDLIPSSVYSTLRLYLISLIEIDLLYRPIDMPLAQGRWHAYLFAANIIKNVKRTYNHYKNKVI